MRTFHFLDAVCLFVVAAFILLETDASPKPSNTKLKNKVPTSSGNAKPNADASPKTSTSNPKLENELSSPGNAKPNADASPKTSASNTKLENELSSPGNSQQKKNPGLTPLNRWDFAASDKGLTLSKPDQLIAEYTGESCGNRSVSAEQPIPKIKSGIFYYEVEILAREGNPISIGLGPTKGIPMQTEIGRNEGYAYDSEGRFWGHKADGWYCFFGRPCIDGKPKFAVRGKTPRDVVGCGVNLKTRQFFYTLNGVLLETMNMQDAELDADLFPTVSLGSSGNKIVANFGPKDFIFNIAKTFGE